MSFSPSRPLRILALVALVAVSSTSCRFGNFSSKDDQKLKDDGFTGFYRNAAARLNYCVKLASEQTQVCVPGELAWGLGDWASSVHDPQPLGLDSSDTNKVLFFTNLEEQRGFTLARTAPTKFSGYVQTDSEELNSPPTCIGTQSFAMAGEIFRQSSMPNYGGYPIAGRTKLTPQWIYQFDGDCTATLADIQACYLAAADCPGADAAARQAMHEHYVDDIFKHAVDAGALDPSDIHDLEFFGYVLIYE